MKRALLLAAAVVAYSVAAWSAAPGFYDSFTPLPYKWVNPPPKFAHGNMPPSPGHQSIRVAANGQTDPVNTVTDDMQPQCSLFADGGSLQATPDRTPISIDIKPVASFPPEPPGIKFLTNVYLITSTTPLSKSALVELSFSDGQPAPSSIYSVEQNGGGWKDLGSTGSAPPFSIAAMTRTLGYFAAGYDASKGTPGTRVGGGQLLPILTAVAIVIVVLAGIPLALLRRRREADEAGEEPES